MSDAFSKLPLSLMNEINDTVEQAVSKNFAIDPLLGHERSVIQSILGSLVKRHGNIIEHAIKAAFVNSPYHTVIETKNFKASPAADRLTEFDRQNLDNFPDLIYFPDQGRNIIPDIVALDNRTCTAIAIEVKRANGSLDNGKKMQTIRDTQGMRMNVRSFVELQGYKVLSGDAKIIEYYGKSGLPEGLTLNKDTIDDFFGITISELVETSTEYLRRKVELILPEKLSSIAA